MSAGIARQIDALSRIVRLLVPMLGQLNQELLREADQDSGRAAIQAQFEDDLQRIQQDIERVWGDTEPNRPTTDIADVVKRILEEVALASSPIPEGADTEETDVQIQALVGAVVSLRASVEFVAHEIDVLRDAIVPR